MSSKDEGEVGGRTFADEEGVEGGGRSSAPSSPHILSKEAGEGVGTFGGAEREEIGEGGVGEAALGGGRGSSSPHISSKEEGAGEEEGAAAAVLVGVEAGGGAESSPHISSNPWEEEVAAFSSPPSPQRSSNPPAGAGEDLKGEEGGGAAEGGDSPQRSSKSFPPAPVAGAGDLAEVEGGGRGSLLHRSSCWWPRVREDHKMTKKSTHKN